jgi:hypothetical protein
MKVYDLSIGKLSTSKIHASNRPFGPRKRLSILLNS